MGSRTLILPETGREKIMSEDKLVRFHLSLNVSDLSKSVKFYRALFGVDPAKLRSDYAKFEPDIPPLVLSLEPTPRQVGGPLNHVGIRLPDIKSLVELQSRLEIAGLRSQREEGVECCYAKQTKFWLHDPDGTLWEIYTLDGDIEHRGDGQRQEMVLENSPSVLRKSEWEHRMGQPIPSEIPLENNSTDEVRLRGTFNLPLLPIQRTQIIAEAIRILKPGGRLFVHVLTAQNPVDSPELPGPASAVHYVPAESEPLKLLSDAGFTAIRLLKFDAKPCFVRNSVAMRETQIEGWKPSANSESLEVSEVMYRGPFESITQDGHTFPLGVRITMSKTSAQRFQTPERSSSFTVFDKPSNAPVCATSCST